MTKIVIIYEEHHLRTTMPLQVCSSHERTQPTTELTQTSFKLQQIFPLQANQATRAKKISPPPPLTPYSFSPTSQVLLSRSLKSETQPSVSTADRYGSTEGPFRRRCSNKALHPLLYPPLKIHDEWDHYQAIAHSSSNHLPHWAPHARTQPHGRYLYCRWDPTATKGREVGR